MHCLNLVENKGTLLTVFACDAFDLWVLKQNHSGEKGRAAVEEAMRLQSYMNDDSFWAILTEAYKVPLTPHPSPLDFALALDLDFALALVLALALDLDLARCMIRPLMRLGKLQVILKCGGMPRRHSLDSSTS